MSAMRVAVYGGSFDPPHLAHQQAVQLVAARDDIDHVLVVPVYEHAFDKSLAAFEHRVQMCQLCWCEPQVEVSRIEENLAHPNYTLDTLHALLGMHPEYQLRLVVGGDVLLDVDKWYRFDEVCRLAPLLPLGRVGAEGSFAPQPVLPDVSSTQVRALLHGRAHQSVQGQLREQLLTLIPPEVLAYIESHGLYR